MDAHLFDSFSRNLSLFLEILVCQEAGGGVSRTMGGSRTVDGDEAVDGDVGDGDENCNRVSATSRSVVRSLITGVCTCACKKNFCKYTIFYTAFLMIKILSVLSGTLHGNKKS